MRIIFLLLFSTQVYAWGEPATATTTVQANITHWTEDPCDFPEHQDKCTTAPEYEPVPGSAAPAATYYGESEQERVEGTPYILDNINYE